MVYPLTFSTAGKKNLITETAYRRRSFLGLMVPEDKVHHGSGIRGQARYQEQEVEVRSHILNQMNKLALTRAQLLSLPKQHHLQGTKWSFVSDYEGHLIQTSTDSILD